MIFIYIILAAVIACICGMAVYNMFAEYEDDNND